MMRYLIALMLLAGCSSPNRNEIDAQAVAITAISVMEETKTETKPLPASKPPAKRAAVAATEIAWLTSWDEAKKQSTKTGEPILVYFTFDGCRPCFELERDVFSSQLCIDVSQKFVCFKCDVERPENQGWNINTCPAIAIFKSGSDVADETYRSEILPKNLKSFVVVLNGALE